MNDYQRIQSAIEYLEANRLKRPSLEELARHIHLSPFHLQRLFRQWAGITPKQFLQFLTRNDAQKLLRGQVSVLEASFATGLSGPGRLHDLVVTIDAVTPGEIRTLGSGLEIHYGFADSPFGICFVASTARGICALSFHEEITSLPVAELHLNWANAFITEDNKEAEATIRRIFGQTQPPQQPFRLLLRGTNFQIKVWEALLNIPVGATSHYQQIAGFVGKPTANRAVGNAVGANPVSYLIPCHRVIRKSGIIGNYRWGSARKKAMLIHERLAGAHE
jgi:AraC family transcriptional regulator of adaptative response/methylated-DNA-[protein]-cysteine methyltransferase